MPTQVLQINYQPKIISTASILLTLSPISLSLLLAITLIILHFLAIKLYRKTNLEKGFSWAMITGSIVIPFLSLLAYIYSYVLIDSAIGQEASKHHGYIFLVMILYPMLLPVYWVVMRKVDRTLIKRLKERKNNALQNQASR